MRSSAMRHGRAPPLAIVSSTHRDEELFWLLNKELISLLGQLITHPFRLSLWTDEAGPAAPREPHHRHISGACRAPSSELHHIYQVRSVHRDAVTKLDAVGRTIRSVHMTRVRGYGSFCCCTHGPVSPPPHPVPHRRFRTCVCLHRPSARAVSRLLVLLPPPGGRQRIWWSQSSVWRPCTAQAIPSAPISRSICRRHGAAATSTPSARFWRRGRVASSIT